ncbi:MAG: hypothetical protein Q8N36_03005, partial [bacterium]|nr:hypothetical protein [bacterium]
MKIALLSCTSRKKPYKCKAAELYSESQNFLYAYKYAKMTCDKVYILSAKYGLVPEYAEIEPYNMTLNEKTLQERIDWSKKVLEDLQAECSLIEDEFLVLAGVSYNKFILPYLKKYKLPLKGMQIGKWIPELKSLIHEEEKRMTNCMKVHLLFNREKRMTWRDIGSVPFNNGIYVMFENGEKIGNLDRIVRIGTHNSNNRLKIRLRDHFITENADGSIFRKNIGRAFLHEKNHPYKAVWELNISRPEVR